ncbi:class I SAM-dependent methyltransferase [Pseudoroseomonas globiformis]|uniref:Class I SAM-dependent methyltransferase n=1 Tax=Teichococcus globiformis TaxID=2307229 RepID=A0ABV7FVS5_9PROT
MNADTHGGWQASTEAWIREMGEAGDYGRRFVLDGPMLACIRGRGFRTALDVGCGEGRFCRLMQLEGISTVGVDPVEALISRARELDPTGEYRVGRAEALGMGSASFDLVVSYLSLIDIPDLSAGLAEMVRVLRPGGTLLIANLTSFATAGMPDGWHSEVGGEPRFVIDGYLEERAVWVAWRGIRVQNWHRPLSAYVGRLLGHGLQLVHFDEPAPEGGDPRDAAHYRRVPLFHLMQWRKPEG